VKQKKRIGYNHQQQSDNMKTTLAIHVLTFFVTGIVFAAESQFERKLHELTAQRDKAVSAALEPIDRRYKEALQQLLKQASQANAQMDAQNIRTAIEALSVAAPPTQTVKVSARTLQRKLDGTEWIGDNSTSWMKKLRFEGATLKFQDAKGLGTGSVKYLIDDDKTIRYTLTNGSEESLVVDDTVTSIRKGKAVYTRQK